MTFSNPIEEKYNSQEWPTGVVDLSLDRLEYFAAQGDKDEFQTHLEEYLRKAANTAVEKLDYAKLVVGTWNLHHGDPAVAKSIFSELITKYPKSCRVKSELACAHSELHEFDAAESLAFEIPETSDAYASALSVMASAKVARADFSGAVPLLKRSLQIDALSMHALGQLVALSFENGWCDIAEPHLLNFLSKDPYCIKVRVWYCGLLIRKALFAEARDQLAVLKVLDPREPQLLALESALTKFTEQH